MSRYVCTPLAGRHDRTRFRCGVPELDDYLRRRAGRGVRRRAAAVFVLSPADEPNRVAGYFTLSAASIVLAELPEEVAKKLPRYPHIPATLIGRLARDTDYPGTGKLLLIDALSRSLRHSGDIAAAAIVVDAKNDSARTFHSPFGFTTLKGHPRRMFLPMKTVEALLNDAP